jgi:hypothetical protein
MRVPLRGTEPFKATNDGRSLHAVSQSTEPFKATNDGRSLHAVNQGTEPFKATNDFSRRVTELSPCAIHSPNGAEAWVAPVKRRQERRPGLRFALYLLLR